MSSITDKIRHLIAKAHGRGTTPEESAILLRKVQEMLDKHQLTEAEVLTEKPEFDTTLIEHRYCDPWVRSLAREVAGLYSCHAWRTEIYEENRKGRRVFKHRIMIGGQREWAFVAQETLDYLVREVVRRSRDYSRDRREQLSFQREAGYVLVWRVHTMASRRQKASPKAANGNSLVVLQHELAVNWATEEFGLSPIRSGGSRSEDDCPEGREAGASISLSEQITPTHEPKHGGFLS